MMEVISWSPHVDSLNSIVEVLRESLIPDSEVQRKVQEKIGMMQKHIDFTNYLLYILRNPQYYEEHIRALSAIILKNNVVATFDTLSHSTLNCIRQNCFALLGDQSKDVRASITTLIGTLVWKGDVASWPDLIPRLCGLLESSDQLLSETALSALFKICEEYLSKRGTEKEEFNESVNVLVAKFITLVTSERIVIRRDAVKILNQAMPDNSPTLKLQLDTKQYFNNLLQIIKDDDVEVQKLVCQAFCIFVELRDGAILPHVHTVIEFMLQKTDHEDSDVALQACEFWFVTSKLPTCRELLLPYMERLLPLMLKNMKYSEYELDTLRNYVGVDEHIEDKPDDIRPFNMRNARSENQDDLDYCNGEGDTYEQTDAIGEPYVGWTLRKCSAASLDSLSLKLGDEILPIFFPLMNQALNNTDFLVKESGILALGAIADGCMNGLKPYLSGLVEYLLECMNSDHSLVRVITCWTLSRFMTWMMNEHSANGNGYFVQVMTVLLKHFLDGNKRVQRAALSAFCIFQEEARLKLVPYIDFILQAFLLCFKRYKFRSYLLLYDAIGVLAQSVGNNLNKPEYIELLLPSLMHKFATSEDYYDEQFMALMESLSNIAIALEVGFLPYAELVYNRSLLIINETVTSIQCYVEHPDDFDQPDRDPMCMAHDMLLGMAIGLKTYFVKFVTNSNLLQNLYYTLQDEVVQVRQPALALYGELIKLCFTHVSVNVHDCIPIVIENLDKRFDIACNNAAWVLGKLCIAMGNKIEPYVPMIADRFMEIMQTMNGTKTMYQTIAIALCTMGLVCPDRVWPHLPIFLRPCCQAMRNVGDCEEKDVGFRGLCELVMRNPAAAANDFIYFCDALASWNDIKPDLKDMIKNMLLCFQSQFGDGWAHVYDQFPPLLKMRLNKLHCPESLLAPLIKTIIDETRKLCKKQPIACGFNSSDNAYEPLKLMQTVMKTTNDICLRYLDNSKLCSLPTPGPPYNAVSAYAVKNNRRRMEDRHVIVHDLNSLFIEQEASPSSYYAIFDGHAGHDAAAYSAAHLHQFLAESKDFVMNPEQALRDAFLKTDTLFLDKCKVENFSSGTTAVCALLRHKEKTLYIGWVGDSQALLVSPGRVVQCVEPHKPCREDEKNRIEQEGGAVIYWGTWRVNGQLAVSRAIGDSEYKPYVTAVPDIVEIPLNGTEDFLILGCDGLWDFITENQAAFCVYNMIARNPDDVESVSQRLVHVAKEQGSCDNISVIVVFLRETSKVAAEAHRAGLIMDNATFDNANSATNNPFAASSPTSMFPKENFVLNLAEPIKQQNGTDKSPDFSDERPTNGKRLADEFDDEDDDEDLGPETDVDAVDDVLLSPTKSLLEGIANNNPLEEEEKAVLETEKAVESAREETPTPPVDSVVNESSGLVDNVADSGEDSDDEWNYFKGDAAGKENVPSSQTDKEVCELKSPAADNETMSQLNPNAAEFVPVSPKRNTASPFHALVDDAVIAQSPRRGAPNNDIDISIPNPQEFECEIKSRPSEVNDCTNGDESDDNAPKLTSQEIMENLLNGKSIEEIEFQPNSSSPVKHKQEEFYFGPNTAFSTPRNPLDQSEALSTKAVFGDESSYLEGKGLESFANETQPKQEDSMSMSFYQNKDDEDTDPFDLNKVQVLPENVDEFISKPEDSFNETISDLPEHDPAGKDEKDLLGEVIEISKVELQPPKSPAPLVEILESPVEAPESPIELPKSPMEAPKSPIEAPKSPIEPLRSPVAPPKSPIEPIRSPVKPPESPVEALKSPVEPPKSPLLDLQFTEDLLQPVEAPKLASPLSEVPKSPLLESPVSARSPVPASPVPKIEEQLVPSQSPVPPEKDLLSSAREELLPSQSPALSEKEIEMSSPAIPQSPILSSSPAPEIESPLEDVTSSVKDSPLLAASPIQKEPEVLEKGAEDVLIPESCAISSPKGSELAETESVATTDVNSFLERSSVPDITSPLSPTQDIFMQLETKQDLAPELIPQANLSIQEQPLVDVEVKTEVIAPEYAVPALATPSEESKAEDIVSKTEDVQEKIETQEKVAKAAAVAAVAGVAAAAAAAVEKKETTPKAKIAPAAAKKATPKTTTSPTKVPPAKPAAKATPSRTSVTATSKATPPPAKAPSKQATSKPRTPTTASSKVPEKALTNGEVKPAVKKALTLAAAKPAPKPASARPSATKIESKLAAKPAPAKPAAPKPAAARPITARPTTLTKITSSASPKTATSATKTVAKTTSLTSPKTTTSAAAAPKPRATSAPLRKVTASKPVPKPADTEKQIKETTNKQITASARTSSAAKTVSKTMTVTRKVESTTKTFGAARTVTKTTTTAAAKKPAELVRHPPSKTKTAAAPVKKPKAAENGVVTENNTAIVTSTTIEESQLVKDASPVDNLLIDNSQLLEAKVTD